MALIPLSAQNAGFAASASSAANRPHSNIPVGGTYAGTGGFKPIPYTTPAGHHEAWMISHHAYTGQAVPRVSRVNVDTGTRCADTAGRPTTWPKPLNTSAGPLGGGSTGNLATTKVVQTVTDGKLARCPAVTTTPLPGFPSGSVGVGRLDMDARANCAYVPLAALTNVPDASDVNGLTGFDEVGGKLYGSLTTGNGTAGGACAFTGNRSFPAPITTRRDFNGNPLPASPELLAGRNTLGGATHPYGYGYNPENNCLYGIGHTGHMFSSNATTGALGC